MKDLDPETFGQWVDEAVQGIPEAFRSRIVNLAIVVEDWPDAWTMRSAGIKNPSGLLGFYHGIPLTSRTQRYGFVLPDKISIYRRPILLQCRTSEEVKALVGRVVRHEVAHYFGIDDDRLVQIGAY